MQRVGRAACGSCVTFENETESSPPPLTVPVPSPLIVQSDAEVAETESVAPVNVIGTASAPPERSIASDAPVTTMLVIVSSDCVVETPSAVTVRDVPELVSATEPAALTTSGAGDAAVAAVVAGAGVVADAVVSAVRWESWQRRGRCPTVVVVASSRLVAAAVVVSVGCRSSHPAWTSHLGSRRASRVGSRGRVGRRGRSGVVVGSGVVSVVGWFTAGGGVVS